MKWANFENNQNTLQAAKQVIQCGKDQRAKKKQVLQDQGYVQRRNAALHGILQNRYYVKGVERNKIIINEYLRLHLVFVMLEVSKALYTKWIEKATDTASKNSKSSL